MHPRLLDRIVANMAIIRATLLFICAFGLNLHYAQAYALPQPYFSFFSHHNNAGRLSHRSPDPVSQLVYIAPTSLSCSNAPFPVECSPASSAISPLISSFSTYSITTAPEQAALLSWMAFESADFKFNQNHFPAPGRPGQGTRCMLMPNFVALYAASIPQLTSQAAAAVSDPVATLALVENDEFGWGSAAWFYSTQCSDSVKEGVKTGGQTGWEAFLTQCVGTTVDEGVGDLSRLAYWTRANEALGIV